jgi:hypothetical protein
VPVEGNECEREMYAKTEIMQISLKATKPEIDLYIIEQQTVQYFNELFALFIVLALIFYFCLVKRNYGSL